MNACCPICADSNTNPRFEISKDGHRFRFSECRSCGHIYLDSIPDRESILAVNKSIYASGNRVAEDYGVRLEGKGFTEAMFRAWQNGYQAAVDAINRGTMAAVFGRLPANPIILDLGCGRGSYIKSFRSRFPGKYFGLDLSWESLRDSRQSGVSGVLADLNALPIRSASVDLAFISGTLHLMADPHLLLAEAVRVLKPGGLFVTESAIFPESTQSRLYLKLDTSLLAHRLHFFSKASIERLCNAHFEDILFLNPSGLSLLGVSGLTLPRLPGLSAVALPFSVLACLGLNAWDFLAGRRIRPFVVCSARRMTAASDAVDA